LWILLFFCRKLFFAFFGSKESEMKETVRKARAGQILALAR